MGDATNILSVGVLLENVSTVGVRKALLVLREFERMARESVEGQAIELDWIAAGTFDLEDRDYVRMVYKKTCWYTVIAPLRIGVICGSPPGEGRPTDDELLDLVALGFHAGVAFQITDDVLNLVADEGAYGKESAGDLWEGKRTVMLLHFLRTVAHRGPGAGAAPAGRAAAGQGRRRGGAGWPPRWSARGRSSTAGRSPSATRARRWSWSPACSAPPATTTRRTIVIFCARCCTT